MGAKVTVSEAKPAAKPAVNLMRSKPKSILWAGVELQRYGLQDKFLSLLDFINNTHTVPDQHIHFVTSALSKSVIEESHRYFEGCVTLKTRS